MIFVTVSTGHFDPLIEACDALRDRYDFFGQIGSGVHIPKFAHVLTAPPQDIEKYMSEAELVISHGGTGMLSTLYKLKKPTLVIPKQIRYGEANDGQVELAVKWAELGMAVLCMDVKNLAEKIEEAKKFTFRFPTFAPVGRALSSRMRTLAAESGTGAFTSAD